MTDPKPRPNQTLYIRILRQMSPDQKLNKVFELSSFSKQLFLKGLKERFPDYSATEIKQLYLERLDKCHNRNY